MVYGLLDLAAVILFMVSFVFLSYFERKEASIVDRLSITISDYTILVKGLPEVGGVGSVSPGKGGGGGGEKVCPRHPLPVVDAVACVVGLGCGLLLATPRPYVCVCVCACACVCVCTCVCVGRGVGWGAVFGSWCRVMRRAVSNLHPSPLSCLLGSCPCVRTTSTTIPPPRPPPHPLPASPCLVRFPTRWRS